MSKSNDNKEGKKIDDKSPFYRRIFKRKCGPAQTILEANPHYRDLGTEKKKVSSNHMRIEALLAEIRAFRIEEGLWATDHGLHFSSRGSMERDH